jgi:hypothetical protein
MRLTTIPLSAGSMKGMPPVIGFLSSDLALSIGKTMKANNVARK